MRRGPPPPFLPIMIPAALLLFMFILFPTTTTAANASHPCPYDFSPAARIIPRQCFANATSSDDPDTTNCCWYIFTSYIYSAIDYANSTGAVFLPDPEGTVCTSAFVSHLINGGLVPAALMNGGQRCNLNGDPVRFVAGNRPCQYPTLSAVNSAANLSEAQQVCRGGPDQQLRNSQTACKSCQEAVIKAVIGLLNTTKSREFVPCGMAATIGIWAPSLPDPFRFRAYALCMLQVLENVGNLGTSDILPSPPPPPPAAYVPLNGSMTDPVSPSPSGGARLHRIIIVVFTSAGAVLLLAVAVAVLVGVRKVRRRRQRTIEAFGPPATGEPYDGSSTPLPTDGLYIFSKSELRHATNGYDPKLVLGEGGAGKVYLGRLPSGQQVAIKRISKRKKLPEFYQEVEVLAKLRHPHLTTLLGYCVHPKSTHHALVYEYLPGGNLSRALYHGEIPWRRRIRIAADVAEGLCYLHAFPEGTVVHRDVKPTNVLLTESGRAKLSDFGVSRIVPIEETHVSTEVKGTRGYVDPEYFTAGQVSESADVYSFGVVLLELVTGLKAVVPTPSGGAESIVQTAHTVVAAAAAAGDEVDAAKVVDPRLGKSWDKDTVREVFKLAYHCVRPYKNERPGMKEVLTILKRVLADLGGADAPEERDLGVDRIENEYEGQVSGTASDPPSGVAPSDGCSHSPPFTSPSIRGWSSDGDNLAAPGSLGSLLHASPA